MRREKLEHHMTTGMIDGKRSRGKQREKMLDGRTKWLKVGRLIDAPKVTSNRDGCGRSWLPAPKSTAPD